MLPGRVGDHQHPGDRLVVPRGLGRAGEGRPELAGQTPVGAQEIRTCRPLSTWASSARIGSGWATISQWMRAVVASTWSTSGAVLLSCGRRSWGISKSAQELAALVLGLGVGLARELIVGLFDHERGSA